MAGFALEGDQVEALELGRDPPPALARLALGDADEQQRDHVRADAVLEAVEDRPEAEVCP